MITITKAIKDEQLFRTFLQNGDGSLDSWTNWMTYLRCQQGLKILPKRAALIKECTGRDIDQLPAGGFNTSLALVGRRSGKSKIAAVVGAFEAALSGKERLLSRGEIGMVPIISPTKLQSQIVKSYIRAIFESTPMLQNEIVEEQKEGFLLSNGVRIQILVGDFRAVRGFTLLACIVDELAFFGLSEESKVRNDTELIRALLPSLSTTKGRLSCITTPYAMKGLTYKWYKKYWGNNQGKILIWKSPSRTMNPTLDQKIIDTAMEEDRASALSEYGGEFRQDIEIWLPRSVIELVVRKGRKELLPQHSIRYFAFCDVSGGRKEGAGLAIAHKVERKIIVDFAKQYKAPHSPYRIIELMCDELRRYHITGVTGDNYSAEFVADAFAAQRIRYKKSELPKSGLYLELLPRICSKQVELLDDSVAIDQLAGLERRTRSGGKDRVDHPTGAKDDLSNAIAGVVTVASKKVIRVGGGIHK